MLKEIEKKTISKIRDAYYMGPSLARIDQILNEAKSPHIGIETALDSLHEILKSALSEVNEIIQARIEACEIKSAEQARRSVVGSSFAYLIQYLLLVAKSHGVLESSVNISTTIPKELFAKGFVIEVANETQKPDCDLLIWKTEPTRAIILSLKTSLRERASQTYKWKLLLEIAGDKNSNVAKKYDISYPSEVIPKICFATVNFYNEINQPQQRGMLKFFDSAFIAKHGFEDNDIITPLSRLIAYIQQEVA